LLIEGATQPLSSRVISENPPCCHSRAGGNPLLVQLLRRIETWIPACAGMTAILRGNDSNFSSE